MVANERRESKRFTLNHPVMMGTGGDNRHLAEILDAGVQGMRVRLTNQADVQVGHEIDIACLPQEGRFDGLSLRCRVAWENTENLEVGLKYLQ